MVNPRPIMIEISRLRQLILKQILIYRLLISISFPFPFQHSQLVAGTPTHSNSGSHHRIDYTRTPSTREKLSAKRIQRRDTVMDPPSPTFSNLPLPIDMLVDELDDLDLQPAENEDVFPPGLFQLPLFPDSDIQEEENEFDLDLFSGIIPPQSPELPRASDNHKWCSHKSHWVANELFGNGDICNGCHLKFHGETLLLHARYTDCYHVGLLWCTSGRHFRPEAKFGTYSTCEDCRNMQRERRQRAREQNANLPPPPQDDDINNQPPLEPHEAALNLNQPSEIQDLDPQPANAESAVSNIEKIYLLAARQALMDIKMEYCNCCKERCLHLLMQCILKTI
ncbi:hypothetical protein J3R30DRAFT_3421029, partial [Lentinula aciculospora]